MEKYSLIGKSIKRVDVTSKATGEAIFSADIKLSRMLVGKVLRSPHPHARIIHIDTSKAEMGSSQTIRSGCNAMERATPMRWR